MNEREYIKESVAFPTNTGLNRNIYSLIDSCIGKADNTCRPKWNILETGRMGMQPNIHQISQRMTSELNKMIKRKMFGNLLS